MQTSSNNKIFITLVLFSFLFSCSKKDSTILPVLTDSCAGKNIVVTASPTSATPCTGNGSISATATGSTNFSYKLNSTGTYQTATNFSSLAPGNYILFAKDGSGCEKSVAVIVLESGAAGALFTEVKNLVTSKCQSCHNTTLANGGINFDLECTIITSKARIKVRAVDEGTMPKSGPLSQSDKDKITNWINAGGNYAN